LERIVAVSGRNSGGVNDGSDVAFVADVAEVGGEAVAGVDHCRSKVVLAEVSTEGDAGTGIVVLEMCSWPEFLSGAKLLQRCNRGAERSAYINDVAGAGAGAKYGFALRDIADDEDVGENALGRLRRVSAGQSHRISARELEESAHEFIDPALREIGG
jgi:hypothetical protein